MKNKYLIGAMIALGLVATFAEATQKDGKTVTRAGELPPPDCGPLCGYVAVN